MKVFFPFNSGSFFTTHELIWLMTLKLYNDEKRNPVPSLVVGGPSEGTSLL